MPENCRHWQGLLAEHVLASARDDGTHPAMDDALAEHLAGCTECRAAAAEFQATAAALAHTTAQNAAPVATLISGDLPARIAARVDQERHRRNRRRRTAVLSTAAALMVVVSVMAVRHGQSNDNTSGERVALSANGMQSEATLQAWEWGTQIRLAVSGSTPGQHYNVWLERADGTRIGAGTFIGVRNKEFIVVLGSAVPSSEAIAIGISKPDGNLVVRVRLD
jgi:hypothetical protein